MQRKYLFGSTVSTFLFFTIMWGNCASLKKLHHISRFLRSVALFARGITVLLCLNSCIPYIPFIWKAKQLIYELFLLFSQTRLFWIPFLYDDIFARSYNNYLSNNEPSLAPKIYIWMPPLLLQLIEAKER